MGNMILIFFLVFETTKKTIFYGSALSLPSLVDLNALLSIQLHQSLAMTTMTAVALFGGVSFLVWVRRRERVEAGEVARWIC